MVSLYALWYETAQHIEDGIVQGYDRMARSIARRPILWILAMSLVAAICGIGLLKIEMVNSSETLWAPLNTEAKRDLKFLDTKFAPLTRAGNLLFTATDQVGYNLVSLKAFDSLWDAHEKVINSVEGNGKRFKDLCANRDPQGRCMVYGVLQFFNGNRTYYNSVVHTRTDLITRISAATFPDGTGVLRTQIFGNFSTNPVNQAIIKCSAMMQFYFIKEHPLDDALAWEKDLVSTLEHADTSDVKIYPNSNSAADNALAEFDPLLMYVMYAIVVAIVLLTFTRGSNLTDARVGLGVCGLLLIALSIVAGYGICSGLGIFNVTVNAPLPFIIVAVGVNDLYLITSAFDAQDGSLSVEDRLAGAMRKCGKGIGFTAVVSASAFYLATLTRFYAIRHFCYYAGTCILCNYVLMMTFFCAVVVLDAHRRDAQRWDVFCCMTSPRTQQTVRPFELVDGMDEKVENPVPGAVASSPSPSAHDEESAVKYAPIGDEPAEVPTKSRRAAQELTPLEYFFSEFYVPVLRHPVARLFIVLGFAGLLVANIFGIYKVEQYFEVTQIIPADTAVHESITQARALSLYAPEQNAPATIVFKELYYHNQSVQVEILRLQEAFLENTAYNQGPMISWVTAFTSWVKSPLSPYRLLVNPQGYLTNEAIFYSAVQRFTKIPQFRRFQNDIVFVNATSGSSPIVISHSRVQGFHKNMRGPIASSNTMRHARKLMGDSSLDPKPFVVSPPYTRTEGYEISVREVISYFVAVLVAVAGVSLIVLKPHSVVLAALTLVLVAMTQVNFVGNMAWWGFTININFATLVFLCFSTALVVDYVLHVLHRYTQQPSAAAPLDRLLDTLLEVGPSILLGGLTMLVAIIPLAFSEVYVLKVFFRMAFCIICYSLGHGLLLLPAVLPTVSFLMCETCLLANKPPPAAGLDQEKKSVELVKPGPPPQDDMEAQALKKEDEVQAFHLNEDE